ncbi:MAG: hypothetical protein KA312_00540 [Sphingorhabdus sp.]|nr:hypothetical protein [Sphingorhabdus sp.]
MRIREYCSILAIALATACIAGCNNAADFRYFEIASWHPTALPKLAVLDESPTFFGPSDTYEGLWLNEFETDYFVEGLSHHKGNYDNDDLNTWIYPRVEGFLAPGSGRKLQFSSVGDEFPAYISKVKFIGRRNLLPSFYGFGHLGTCSRAIVVEKIISIKPIEK